MKRWHLVWFAAVLAAGAQAGDDGLRQRANVASELRQSKPEQGLEQALEVAGEARAAADRQALARALLAAGENLNVLGRNTEALDYYRRALEVYRELDEPVWQARALRGVGVAYYDTGRSDEALEHYLGALQLFDQAGDELEAAKTRANIGNVHLALGHYDHAIHYQRAALASFRAQGFTAGVAGVSMNLGSALHGKGRETADAGKQSEALYFFRQARELQQQALAMFTQLGIPRGIQKALNNLGSIALSLGEAQVAQDYFVRSMAMAREIGDRLEVLQTANNLLELYLDRGEHEQAHALLQESLASELGSVEVRNRLHELAVRYYEATGDFAQALKHERARGTRHEEERSRNVASRVAELELQLQAQRQEQQIRDLRREQQIAGLELDRQRMLRNSAVAGAAVVFLLLALLYGRYRMRVRTAEILEQAATTDVLTGLLNRRGIMPRLAAEQARFLRYEKALSLILCDIDDFKRVNDGFGHDTGDRVLAEVAVRIAARLRGADFAARWGGEEFLLLLPETGLEGARELAEAVRRSVGEPLALDGHQVVVGLSLGVACMRPGMSSDDLIHAADAALLQAKRDGKNRVVVAGQGPEGQ